MDKNREVGLSASEASSGNKPNGTYTLRLVGVDDPEENKFGGAPRCKFRFQVLEFEPEDWPIADDYPDDQQGFEEAEAWATQAAEAMIGKELHFRYTMALGERGYLYAPYRALYRRDIPKDHKPQPWSLINREIVATIQSVAPPSGGDPRPQIVAAKPYRKPAERMTKSELAAGVQLAEGESVDSVPF